MRVGVRAILSDATGRGATWMREDEIVLAADGMPIYDPRCMAAESDQKYMTSLMRASLPPALIPYRDKRQRRRKDPERRIEHGAF